MTRNPAHWRLGDPLAEPAQMTVAGDWHGNGRWGAHVLSQAAEAGSDVLVHTGDFGIWAGGAGARFLDAISGATRKHGIPVIFVDGNHENFDMLEAMDVDPDTGLRLVAPGIFHAPRGFRWTWAGMNFLALGGATSLDRPSRTPWVSWWPQEEITGAQARAAAAGGPADVMITHDVPSGFDVPGLGSDMNWSPVEIARANHHRALLRDVVEQVSPTHLFHGHFHLRHESDLTLSSGQVVHINGLACDGFTGAFMHVDLDVLAAESLAARA